MVTLSKDDKELILTNIERTLYKKSYYEFFVKAIHELEPQTSWHIGWYHKYLCDLLQKEAERIHAGKPKTSDYCISIPPRSSKSLLFSSVFNAWLWLYYPSQRILSLSYSDELASSLAYQTKLIFNLDWYIRLNNVFKLRDDDNSKSRYSNTLGGTRYAAGFQATITGFGGDWVIVDDAAKANEIGELKRKAVIEQYKSTIYNRINQPKIGVRFIIGQKIHDMDLIGYLLKTNPENYKYICFPAEISTDIQPKEMICEYEKNGGLLLPELFDRDVLRQYKNALGSYGYSSQYQQRAIPMEGGYIKFDDIQIIQWRDEFKQLTWNMYIDSAYGKKGGDASAILIAAKWNNCTLIKRSYQVFEEFPDLIRTIQRLHSEHCNTLSKVMIEPKASGLSLIQSIKKETKFNIQELQVGKDDKKVRCMAITPITESKRVYVIDGGWNINYLDEVCNFPASAMDDQLDCTVYAIDHLLNKNNAVTYINQAHPTSRIAHQRIK